MSVREAGRQRLYRLDPLALRPVHDWVRGYARLWEDRFAEMDAVLGELTAKEADDGDDG